MVIVVPLRLQENFPLKEQWAYNDYVICKNVWINANSILTFKFAFVYKNFEKLFLTKSEQKCPYNPCPSITQKNLYYPSIIIKKSS